MVVGQNLRRLRRAAGLSQKEMARRVRAGGLWWGQPQVCAFENGSREGMDVAALAVLACALDVPAAALLEGDGQVAVAEDAVWTRSAIRAALAGAPISEPIALSGRSRFVAAGGVVVANPHQADFDLAARLRVPADDVIAASRKLWGHSLQEERERLLAEQEPQTMAQRKARRGHITRRLAREIEIVLPLEGGGSRPCASTATLTPTPCT